MDLRCKSKKHGVVIEPGDAVVEIACDSRFCGSAPGVTILHRFNTATGSLVETLQFKSPRKEREHAAHHHPAAVRSA